MKRAFGVVCIISIIYLASLIVGFYKYSINEQNEIQQILLSTAIDYCSDAAMQEIMYEDHLEMDYSKKDYTALNPKLALDTFVDMFCLNYDIGISGEARKHVMQNYIPVACVATFDGYYIATYKPVKNANDYPENKLSDAKWDLVFGPKMPYSYKNGTTAYALNLGLNYAYAIDGLNVTKYMGMPPGLLTKDDGTVQINKILADDIAYSINLANEANSNWKNSFFVPGQLTSFTGVNPITGPSFIALVQNVDLNTVRPISGFSVSGTKINQARMVVAYIRNGISYYCYADKAPGTLNQSNIENMYSSIEDAAKAGYICDLEYMK